MKIPWTRLSLGVIVTVVVVAGAHSLAAPNPYPSSTIKCSKYTCTSPGVCQDPYIGNGYCTQGKNGPGFPSDIACCCCSDRDASNRWFHGE